ncbi:hypothetical protein B9Z19DRAFT_133723 [Tuber borchii]|uniref:Uncharacterized protein n=1 Tax=Tuber borchii TaxID=42251 RepID=A0A2T6ZQP1_TUBBO|nr:hypothetical protein B9Z19DRAFT_133723 [Tuber borchii]
MHVKQFKYYILPIIFCIYNNPLSPPSIAVTLCNQSIPQSNHQTIPPSNKSGSNPSLTTVTSSQTKHIPIVHHHHQGSNSPSTRHKRDPNEPQSCIRSLPRSLLQRRLDSAYNHPSIRNRRKSEKTNNHQIKNPSNFLFPLHFQKEKKKTKQDLVKKRYMHMNFSPLPQSFASDSVKLKSMKKGGKKN